ncbi:hypothetical protein CAOG_05555 [Capsaspora owczarzaki ATCC 30864]|nr:hypothetical protein CAOG_05555 [Capsaspora owczarzaki ATCC 30864]|eukprot:XP_004346228.1 hypothetical protein CAOG_05555 [Capsaspora owczarzaki ATCC 30864]
MTDVQLNEVRTGSIADSSSPDNYLMKNGDPIDYCLVVQTNNKWFEAAAESRNKYLDELQKRFQLTIEHEKSSDGLWECYKVSSSFDRLLHEADRIKLKLSIKCDADYPKISFAEQAARGVINTLMVCCRAGVPLDEEEESFTATFRYDRKDKFLNIEDPKLFFNQTQRSLLVYSMLNRTRFGPKPSDVGVPALQLKNVFTATYPLHDGPTNRETLPPPANSVRYILASKWARFKCFFRFQPLNLIRRYYGEQIGLYYAWLGFYTTWLFIPSILGILVFLYGVGTYKDNEIAQQVCSSSMVICGVCNTCKNYTLSDACNTYQYSNFFDNEATLPFAAIMSLWATLFLEFWKRRNAEIVFDWDVIGLEEDEPPRPQYYGTEMRKDPISGVEEEYYPFKRRIFKFLTSVFAIVTLLACVLIAVVAVLSYRLAVRASFYNRDPSNASALTAFTAALLNLTCIVILNRIYTKLATIMTDWENHRTQTDYDDVLIFKIFLFQFVNSYASIFYVAFFKGKFRNVPGSSDTLFGETLDGCPPYGCMMDLTIQLVIIFTGKQVVGNIIELAVPMLKSISSKRKVDQVNSPQWQRDASLNMFGGLFGEYLEMVLQYGFITLFIAAFPLAPLLGFLNNIVEIRLDAVKLVVTTRRPPPIPAEDIGTWQAILTVVGGISVITNGFVIAFTSEFIPRLVYKDVHGSLNNYIQDSYPTAPVGPPCHYNAWRDTTGEYLPIFWQMLAARFAFVIVFEHVVFILTRIVAFIIPDVPGAVRLALEREKFQADRVMGDN